MARRLAQSLSLTVTRRLGFRRDSGKRSGWGTFGEETIESCRSFAPCGRARRASSLVIVSSTTPPRRGTAKHALLGVCDIGGGPLSNSRAPPTAHHQRYGGGVVTPRGMYVGAKSRADPTCAHSDTYSLSTFWPPGTQRRTQMFSARR
jgi:hypothetical protein